MQKLQASLLFTTLTATLLGACAAPQNAGVQVAHQLASDGDRGVHIAPVVEVQRQALAALAACTRRRPIKNASAIQTGRKGRSKHCEVRSANAVVLHSQTL